MTSTQTAHRCLPTVSGLCEGVKLRLLETDNNDQKFIFILMVLTEYKRVRLTKLGLSFCILHIKAFFFNLLHMLFFIFFIFFFSFLFSLEALSEQGFTLLKVTKIVYPGSAWMPQCNGRGALQGSLCFQ